jgi:hypothetical protein
MAPQTPRSLAYASGSQPYPRHLHRAAAPIESPERLTTPAGTADAFGLTGRFFQPRAQPWEQSSRRGAGPGGAVQ